MSHTRHSLIAKSIQNELICSSTKKNYLGNKFKIIFSASSGEGGDNDDVDNIFCCSSCRNFSSVFASMAVSAITGDDSVVVVVIVVCIVDFMTGCDCTSAVG